jgi:hypothetical protein
VYTSGITASQHYIASETNGSCDNRALKLEYQRHPEYIFLPKITPTKQNYGLLSDATFMLATSQNAIIQENYLKLFGVARFCERPIHQEEENVEESPCIWEHVIGKIRVTFTSDKCVW